MGCQPDLGTWHGRFPAKGAGYVPTQGGMTDMWGQGRGWPHHCAAADILKWPRTERAVPWGKSRGCVDTDHQSGNPRASATATAGTETWTGAACHAGGAGAPWKESGNGLPSLRGTVCAGVGLRHRIHLWAEGRGREAPPPPRFHGTRARHTRSVWTDVRNLPSLW